MRGCSEPARIAYPAASGRATALAAGRSGASTRVCPSLREVFPASVHPRR